MYESDQSKRSLSKRMRAAPQRWSQLYREDAEQKFWSIQTYMRWGIKKYGQATKSTRGMPWHREPKKDVTNCEKPRGAVSER